MKINTLAEFLKLPQYEQKLDLFLTLPPQEQEMFKSKLNHVFNKNENFFMYAAVIVVSAEATGFLKDVKYGSEIFNNTAEEDLLVGDLSAASLITQQ